MNISTRIVVLLIVFTLVTGAESNAQPTTVTASYFPNSGLPLWLGKKAGFFARNEFNVQPVRVHAAAGVMVLLSGTAIRQTIYLR